MTSPSQGSSNRIARSLGLSARDLHLHPIPLGIVAHLVFGEVIAHQRQELLQLLRQATQLHLQSLSLGEGPHLPPPMAHKLARVCKVQRQIGATPIVTPR
jgi:hypothetical protein